MSDTSMRNISAERIRKTATLCSRFALRHGKKIVFISIRMFSFSPFRVFYHLGLRPGDRLAIYLPNTTEYPYLVLGAMLCGAVVSPSEPRMSAEDIASQLKDLEAKLVVTHEDLRAKVERAREEAGLQESLNMVVLSLLGKCTSDEGNGVYDLMYLLKNAEDMDKVPDEINAVFKEDDVALVLWSSGATGRPKGVQLQNKVFLSYLASTLHHGITELFFGCFYHIPFILSLSRSFSDFASVFFPLEDIDSFEGYAEKVFKAVAYFRPWVWVGSSFFMQRLFDAKRREEEDLTSLQTLCPMGASVPENIVQELRKHFPNLKIVYQLYSMTEIPQAICLSKPGGVLEIVGQSEIKLSDLDTGKACKPHEVGEILVKGHFAMKGYLKRPEENDKFFGKDGFLHTGDLAYYDEDGLLHYSGRLKTFIKNKNFKVFPEPLEQLIMGHASVMDVAVFPKPDPVNREAATAAVVKKAGADVTEEEIISLVDDRTEDKNRLRGGVVFVDELPRNPRGKVLRWRLTQMFSHQMK